LECANLTQPNIALIGEEIEAKRMSLSSIVAEIADTVLLRAEEGKRFGVVLIHEGLVEYIPEVNTLLREISMARASTAKKKADLVSLLTPWSSALLRSLPPFIQRQLLLEAQASDLKAQYSQIETERLLADLVRIELKRRRDIAQIEAEWCAPDPKFSAVCFYLGYQARSSMPSNFDCDLAYTIGCTAAALVAAGATAYMATAHCLTSAPSDWRVCGTPLYTLLSAEGRAGQAIAAIRPSQVRLSGRSFKHFASHRDEWKMSDQYCNPGPLQFSGDLAFNRANPSAEAEAGKRAAELREIAAICQQVESSCWPGCSEAVLRNTLASLRALKESLDVLQERDASTTTQPAPYHARTTQLTQAQIAQRDN